MATTFHRLTVRDVEPLTDDSAAVTFDVPDDLRELFAWALREGTTNVLRHAAASRVRVTMTSDTLVVDDDGFGPANTEVVPGNGLRGLSERARQVGAHVEVSASPLGGYQLLVTTKNGAR